MPWPGNPIADINVYLAFKTGEVFKSISSTRVILFIRGEALQFWNTGIPTVWVRRGACLGSLTGEPGWEIERRARTALLQNDQAYCL